MSEEGEREEEEGEEESVHTSDEEEQEDPRDYCKGQSAACASRRADHTSRLALVTCDNNRDWVICQTWELSSPLVGAQSALHYSLVPH